MEEDRDSLTRLATELAQQAYDVKVNAYGDTHPDVAASLNLLGLIYQDQGNT
ncbi:tetratricopeptide repeat protein [Leptothoe sp. ISB3NOV94-8A]